MPLFKKIIDKNFTLVVWHLTESIDLFLPFKKSFSASPEKLDEIHAEQRRKEWICSRYLGWSIAKEMEGKCAGVWSDDHNKPHIKDSNLQISISHAKPYVAVMVHKSETCGVDIEEKKEKLIKLTDKFLRKDEQPQSLDDLSALALGWGGKEAIYKYYGRKQLIFKRDLSVIGLSNIKEKGSLLGKLMIDNRTTDITLFYEQFDNHILIHTT